jgi:hypothetical protein
LPWLAGWLLAMIEATYHPSGADNSSQIGHQAAYLG